MLTCHRITALAALGLLLPHVTVAQPAETTAAELRSLRQAIEAQQRRLNEQAAQLERQRRQIDAQMREVEALRGSPARPQPAPRTPAAARGQAAAPPPAVPATAQDAAAQARRDERRVLETDPTLSRIGGVLTPRGALSFEPSIDYGYNSQNRALVNGFTIIPGITFGNVDIRSVQSRTMTSSATLRLGLTNRLEVNTRIPLIYAANSTQTAPVDINASPVTISPQGFGFGDVEFGAAYQINSGQQGWPVAIANLRVKTATGRSPFDVPVFTVQDPQGQFIRGLERRLPTGTGFWSVEPGITLVYPTDPGVLFGGIRYIWNVADRVNLQSDTGGPPRRTRLNPGDGIGLTFGLGFALNETTSLSLGYEHVRVFNSSQDGRTIAGSNFDLGTLNVGLSYRWSDRVSVNLATAIGVTNNTPAARVLVRVPIRFNLF